MGDEKKLHNQDEMDKTFGCVPKGDHGVAMVELESPSLEYIDAFINLLRSEFRYIVIFVRSTATDPEVAVTLEANEFWKLCSELGRMRAIESLARVPVDSDLEYLLPFYINGRRSALVKRMNLADGQEPLQVFLDRHGRPMTVEKVDAALRRFSESLKMETSVTLAAIVQTVIDCHFSKIASAEEHLSQT